MKTLTTLIVLSLSAFAPAYALDLTGTWDMDISCTSYQENTQPWTTRWPSIPVQISMVPADNQNAQRAYMRLGVPSDTVFFGTAFSADIHSDKGYIGMPICPNVSGVSGPESAETVFGSADTNPVTGKGRITADIVRAVNAGNGILVCHFTAIRIDVTDPGVTCP
jgi:hypothetical protein